MFRIIQVTELKSRKIRKVSETESWLLKICTKFTKCKLREKLIKEKEGNERKHITNTINKEDYKGQIWTTVSQKLDRLEEINIILGTEAPCTLCNCVMILTISIHDTVYRQVVSRPDQWQLILSNILSSSLAYT